MPEFGYNIELFYVFICFDFCGLLSICESMGAVAEFWTRKFLPRDIFAKLLFLVEFKFC